MGSKQQYKSLVTTNQCDTRRTEGKTDSFEWHSSDGYTIAKSAAHFHQVHAFSFSFIIKMAHKKGTSNRQKYKWNTEIRCLKYLGFWQEKKKERKNTFKQWWISQTHVWKRLSFHQPNVQINYLPGSGKGIYQKKKKVNKSVSSYYAQFISKVIKERPVKTIPGMTPRQRWVKCLLCRNHFWWLVADEW